MRAHELSQHRSLSCLNPQLRLTLMFCLPQLSPEACSDPKAHRPCLAPAQGPTSPDLLTFLAHLILIQPGSLSPLLPEGQVDSFAN